MSRHLGLAFVGALALAAASFSAAPASALPMPAPLAATPSDGAGIEQVYIVRRRPFFRRGYAYRRPFFRRGYGYRRPFLRRGLPGHPIRRLLRHL